MSGNLISFKKKLTMEQKDVDFLRLKLTEILNDELMLTGYINRPYLATEKLREQLATILGATLKAAIEWLIASLGDKSSEESEQAYESYQRLIKWFRKEKVPGERFAFTLVLNKGTEVSQYAFIYNNEGQVGFIGYYDERKDIITAIIENMNKGGMQLLGFDHDEAFL